MPRKSTSPRSRKKKAAAESEGVPVAREQIATEEKKPSGRRRASKRATAKPDEKGPVASVASAVQDKPTSGERAGEDEIVIRFPPAGAPPFPTPTPRADRRQQDRPSPPLDFDAVEEAERTERPGLDVVEDDDRETIDHDAPPLSSRFEADDDIEPPDDDDLPATATSAQSGPPRDSDAERRLSPSQRRRLRRKRRREALRDGNGAAVAGSSNEPPAHDRPPVANERRHTPPNRPAPPGQPARTDRQHPGNRRRDEPPRPTFRSDAPPRSNNRDEPPTDRFETETPPADLPPSEHPAHRPATESSDARADERGTDRSQRGQQRPGDRAPRDGDRDGGRRRGRRGRRGGRGRGGRRYDEFSNEADSRSPDDRHDRTVHAIGDEPDDEPLIETASEATAEIEFDRDDFEEVAVGEEQSKARTDVELAVDDEVETPEETGVKARREMIINVVPREECRIAILKDGRLEEIYIERASSESHVGNIYKGRITNVEPSIQAAFIDFGLEKNGFLHISDLHPRYFPNRAGDSEDVGHKTPRRERPPIQRCLRRGQEVLVQIIKEGIGTKGPTLSTYLSIPGRFLVMLPGMSRAGVSRKIEDPEIRDKLRGQMNELELPGDMGFIARTAAVDRTKRELQNDLNYLTRLWRSVEQRVNHDRAPAEVYRESDLVIRTIRDVFSSDIARIVVDQEPVADRAREFLSIFSPRSRDSIQVYKEREPVFHKYGIEAELERLHSRHVPLRSGGSLVIDSTEALVAIDVNSGRFREEDDAEATAFKINCEAANEIPRQLRLRDLGGVIICDFIDMRLEKHRREIERILIRNLKEHKERAKVLKMSRFGIIEMTRQRQRASLTRNVYQDCHHCRGTGLVKTVESVALDVMRLVQLASTREHIASIEVVVSPDVAYLLQNRKRAAIHVLESENRRTIAIRPDPHHGLDQVQMNYLDSRGRVVPSN